MGLSERIEGRPISRDSGCLIASTHFRAEASKETLYIGSTSNLRRRVFGNYIGGVGGTTTQRIHSQLFDGDWFTKIQISWIETEDPRQEERRLIQQHKKDHGKLPP